jgi:uncharacterized protein involved in exopolysaccharide biosynthesis
MSDPNYPTAADQNPPAPPDTNPEPSGPNLVLYFALIAFALAAAIAIALMIVRPFYLHR